MGLLDPFSDSNEKQAANTVKKGYNRGFRDAKKNLNKGFGGLKKDYARGLDSISGGADTATGAITSGRDASLSYYDPFVAGTTAASGLYTDALGVNGAGGNARAVGAFQVSPGYEFQLNQGLDALDRRAASRGMLASGNNAIDTMDYSQGLANQEYGGWLDRLAGQQALGVDIAGQRAGIQTGAAGALADVATNAATKRAAIQTARGDVRMGLGERMADLSYATRLGKAGIKADYLAGKDQSGMNIVGAVTGGTSLGAKLLGAG